MAAVTGVRLANLVITSVMSKFISFSTFLWSDSQIVLRWIHHLKLSTQSKPFIANRIQEIKSVEHWTYVLCHNCKQSSRFTNKRIVPTITAYNTALAIWAFMAIIRHSVTNVVSH